MNTRRRFSRMGFAFFTSKNEQVKSDNPKPMASQAKCQFDVISIEISLVFASMVTVNPEVSPA